MGPKAESGNNMPGKRRSAKVLSATRRQKVVRLTAVLAAFVVFCTAWALMVPALTITQENAQPESGFFGNTATQDAGAPQNAAAGLAAGAAPSLTPATPAAAPSATDPATPGTPDADDTATANSAPTGTLKAEGDTYAIAVEYDAAAEIPDGADLAVREILPGTVEFDGYLRNSAAQLGVELEAVSFARFFDIEIIDALGDKVEPATPVQVQISYPEPLEVASAEDVNVVHFADEGTEVISEVDLTKNDTEVTYQQESFSVTGTIVSGNGDPTSQYDYVVVIKHNGEYYAVQNDGSLDEVAYSVSQNVAAVTVDFPMVWKYRSAQDTAWYEPYVLRMAAEAADFDGNDLPTMYSYRYIDPNSDEGIREEEIYGRGNVQNLAWDCELRYEESDHTLHGTELDTSHGGYQYPSNGKYIGVKEENGKLRIVGNQTQGNAAEVYLARITTVPEPYGTGNTVNHIDISVQGAVDISAPLAFGTYYYYDDNGAIQTLEVSSTKPVISHVYDYPVAIKRPDMMKADITAYKKNADGSTTNLDDMFYVTGYSLNANENAGYEEPDQVRIEGSFKVSYTDVPGNNGNAQSRAARLATPVYYSVSAPKDVVIPLQYTYTDDNDQLHAYPLYAQNPEETGESPLTTNATVTLTASFTFWDFEHNTCPAAVLNLGGDWHAGDIPDGNDGDKFHSGSGMDFVLGADASSQAKVYAVEITKIVVDENGNRIKSSNAGSNTFHIYKNETGTADSVKDLNVGAATEVPDYTGYQAQHDKEVTVGADGLGMMFDYDVSPGLYYIAEDPDSISDKITDTTGQQWDYKETYFLTEYAWRHHANDNYMHVSQTYQDGNGAYASVPEYLGDHPSYDGAEVFTNDFLEFYVYNVYESPKVDVPVVKTWPDFDDDDAYDWTATFKLQWAPIYPGEQTTSESFEDVSPLQEITITKDQMASDDPQDLANRTFKDLPKYGTDKNGNTFRYQYSLEETSYQVTNMNTGVILYSWSETEGYNTPDEDTHYQPFYPHDAGEDAEDDDDYYIQVRNAKRNIRDKEYIDVSLDKQWDETFTDIDETRYAKFELRRFVHTQYRDVSHMSDSDRTADPVTVSIVDAGGTLIDSLDVQPNVGVYLAGNFKPHEGDKSVSFTTQTPVRLPSGSHVSTITASADGSNMSNALVRSQEFFVTHDTVFTLSEGAENLISPAEGKIARVLDTSAGTSPLPDRTFSQEVVLDSSNNWHVALDNLVRSVTSSGDDDDNENVTYYEYYFVEIESSPKGYAEYFLADIDGDPTAVSLGDSDHQIETDAAIVAVNGPANRLLVEKRWRGISDATGFPHVKFTLYQTWADDQNGNGWVYENEVTHARYEHVEIPSTSLTWLCPEVLPETRRDGSTSRAVKYYVLEDEQSGSYPTEDITTSWQFYYYRNSNGVQTNAGHQPHYVALNGSDLADNGGTITICNKMGAYTDLGIKKKFYELWEAGSWADTTSDQTRGAVLGFKVIRAIKSPYGGYLDAKGQPSEEPVWMDCSDEMLCGYDASGNHVVWSGPDNPFYIKYMGLWHFQIMNNEGDATNIHAPDSGSGLPTYGFYILNGEDVPVEYEYSFRETNVYKDLDGTPYPEWDWYSSITPLNIDGDSDEDRVINYQASDLLVDKEWIGDVSASEVYVKIWRVADNEAPEDFTKIIAQDVKNNRNWQMYVEDDSEIDVNHEWLVLKDDGSGQWTDALKVNRALIGTVDGAKPYRYYVQEVGYRTHDGQLRTNVNAKFKPLYDHWVGSVDDGNWTGSPVGMNDFASNSISIGAKGENRLRVINRSTPSTSYSVTKAFTGSQSSTGGQSSVTGRYPTDGSRQVVVILQQRYRYEKTEGGIAYVSADNANWVEASSAEAAATWTQDWQVAESASPASIVLPRPKPAGSTYSDAAWYGSSAAWSYTWEGLDVKKVMAEAPNPADTVTTQLYYRAVEASTPEWLGSFIASEESAGHIAIDDDEQTAAGVLGERNTVTNVQGQCDLDLNKEWTGLGAGKTWPEGYTVDYQLVQEYHLATTSVTGTEVIDGITVVKPEYSYGKVFKKVDMVRAFAEGMTADNVHTQAVRTIDNANVVEIAGLPMYGFLVASAADVEAAAQVGVTLVEGITYPVVYTYSVRETSVKKDGVEVGFKAQIAAAKRDETVSEGVSYEASLVNELVDIEVEKEWNGLTPGGSESAEIGLYRFERDPEPEPETSFTYTVAVTGDEAVLASDGAVTVTVYDEAGEVVDTYTLRKNDWVHEFELAIGGTYHAEFAGDGTVLESEVTPGSAEGIEAQTSTELVASVKPSASGSVKVVVTGSPHGLWMSPLAQYVNGQRQDSTEQSWDAYFDGHGGETKTLGGLIPGAEYRFQIGVAPSSIEGASYGGGFVSFTAADGLTTITLNYSGGSANTTSGTFEGSNNYWGINDWNNLTVGETYSFTFQVGSDPSLWVVEATGVSGSLSYSVANSWGNGGQITVSFVPASADEAVSIVASPAAGARGMRTLTAAGGRAGLLAAGPVRAPSIPWHNDDSTLPEGADPDSDYLVDIVTFRDSTWSKSWDELPKYASNGKEYVYYAYETDYSGASGATSMSTSYSVDTDGNIVVTNTPTYPDAGNLKVEKEVFYGNALNTEADGLSFTVGIFADAAGTMRVDGQEDKTITVTDGEGEVTFTGLSDGTYYVYEVVDGSPVVASGAKATVDGKEYTVTYEGNGASVVAGETATAKVVNTKQPYELNILKLENDDTGKPLDGAVFELYKLVVNSDTGIASRVGEAEATVTTANGGKAKFENLALGCYEVEESKAPDGYHMPEDNVFCIRVTTAGVALVLRDDTLPMDEWQVVSTDGPVTFTAEDETYTATVANEPGSPLPHTGGPGVAPLMLIGFFLVVLALAMSRGNREADSSRPTLRITRV